MSKKTMDVDAILSRAQPLVHQQAVEIQPYGHLVKLPNALAEDVCKESVENLNQLLADTITLRDLYKKHHWQVAGPTFYQLHLLFDKHYEQQNELVDAIEACRHPQLESLGLLPAGDPQRLPQCGLRPLPTPVSNQQIRPWTPRPFYSAER